MITDGLLRRREAPTHTMGRGTSWRIWRVRLVRFRSPIVEDPYVIGFDQHDDRNYTTEAWTLLAGRLELRWKVKL